MTTLNVALVQMNATDDKPENVQKALMWVSRAIQKKADFILLPEMFNFRAINETSIREPELLTGASISALQIQAKAHGVSILAGSIAEFIPNSEKVYNTSVLINEKGAIQCVYRKIHLFDADLDCTSIRESHTYEAGTRPQLASVGGFTCGLSVCFDLRFPYLYQYYAQKKADCLLIPASFASPTGKDHWEILLRARAIETQSYVLAPNQVGPGARGVDTYGHSAIIDPWGHICAMAEREESLVCASMQASEIRKVRHNIPLHSKRDALPNH
jgi:deaminated glutathione amidase